MKKFFIVLTLIVLMFSATVQINVSAAENLPNFTHLAYGNGMFVAIDDSSGIAVSRDCVNWYYVIYKSTIYKFTRIIWGNNEFMVLAQDPKDNTSTKVLRSRYGLKWDAVNDNLTRKGIYSISWTGNKYIAVGYRLLLTSIDGETWTKQDIKEATYLNDVIYDGNEYTAVGGYMGSGRVLQSQDGQTWTNWYELMDNCGDNSFEKIFYAGGFYLLKTTYGGVYYSKNLVDGHIVYVDSTNNIWCSLEDMTYNGEMFVSISKAGNIYTSTDGEKWTNRTVKDLGNYSLRSVTYLNGRYYILGGSDKTKLLLSSKDGIIWSITQLTNINIDPSSIPEDFNSIVVNDSSETRSTLTGKVFKPDGALLTGDQYKQISISLNSSTGGKAVGLNSDGTYSIGTDDIPNGDYTVIADTICFTGQYANSKPQVIHITKGRTIVCDLQLTVPTITGRVLKPDGTDYIPEKINGYYTNEEVQLFSVDKESCIERKKIGSDGLYCIGADIPTGYYRLRVDTESGFIIGNYTNSIDELVYVTQGQSINLNLKLTNPVIRGRLLKPDGTDYNPSGMNLKLEAVNDPNFKAIYTTPNSDGSFRLSGNVPTGDYNIIADYYINPQMPYIGPEPVKVHVTSGETVVKNITLYYALEITKASIENNQSNVENNPNIDFTFNENIKSGPNYDKISLSGEGKINSKIIQPANTEKQCIFTLSTSLNQNTNYTIAIPEGAFIDDNQKYNKPFILSFSTKRVDGNNSEEKKPDIKINNPVIIPGASIPTAQVLKKVLIKVIKTTPGENATGIENAVKSVIVFDANKIKQGDNFDKISVSGGGKLVSKEISTDGSSIILNISSKFAKKVSVTIPEGAVKSEDGLPNSTYSYNFTVKESDESLKVVSTTPQNGQSAEDPELIVKIVFSRKGLTEGDNFKDIAITGGAVIATKKFDTYGASLILKLSGIEKDKKYSISIPKGAVNDDSGIQNEAYFFGFNTNTVRKFCDIPSDYWAFSAINEMVRNSIISGFPDNSYRPNNMITREQFAKIMVLALKLNLENPSVGTFADVQKSQWSYSYIETAKDFLTRFKKDGQYNFKGAEYTVREDIAVALVKALKLDNMQVDAEELKSIFKDEKDISPNLKKYVLIAYKNKLIAGYKDHSFKPTGKVTRAEAAMLLYRVMKEWVPEDKVAVGDIQS
jgi:hypothetical protein